MRYKNPEVERFYRYWKMMDELERQEKAKDVQDKLNGKLAIQRTYK